MPVAHEPPGEPPTGPGVWTLTRVLLLFLTVFGCQLLVAVALMVGLRFADTARAKEWVTPLLVLLSPGTMAAVLWARRRRQGAKPLWVWSELRDPGGWGLALFSLLLNLAATILYAHATKGAQPELSREVMSAVAGSPGVPWVKLAVLFAGIVVLAPLSEEWLFRGIFQGVLHARWGPWVAIPASAVVFGGFHGLDQWLVTGIFGLGFGWVALRRPSLTFSMIAHGAWNLLAFSQLVMAGVLQ